MADPNDRFERVISREKESWRELNNCMEHLKNLMQRVKAEGVKEGVDRVSLVYNKLMKQRVELHAEYRAKLHAAEREVEVASNKFTGRVETTESRVLGALEAVSDKLAEQGNTLEQVQRKLADQDKVLSVLAALTPTPRPGTRPGTRPGAEVDGSRQAFESRPIETAQHPGDEGTRTK